MLDNFDADKAAIISRIKTETRAYWEKDWETWVNCWVHQPYVRREGWWSLGGITRRIGWDEVRERMRSQFQKYPEPNRSAYEFRMENVTVRAGADIAWVTYDEHAPDTGEPAMDMPGVTHEIKILEKHDGEWLLAYNGYLHHTVHQIDYPLLEVDSTGRVLWQNEQSARELSNGCALKIVGDRVFGSKKADSARLMDALGWAASLCDIADPQSGTLPIVLYSDESDQFQLCWVMANSGKIFVAINNQKLVEKRLAAAALIHGLTPAQTRLLREIVSGHDLPSAATKLGVKPTTLRTQLQRIYDKVGVRNQPALVSILMSSIAPTI